MSDITYRGAEAEEGTMPSNTEEKNLRKLRQSLDHNGLDAALTALHTFYAADFLRHGDNGDYDQQALGEGLRRMYTGFPDMKRVQRDFVVEGERIAYRWEATGTHLGEYLGVRPTNRPVRTQGIVICRFEDGLIAEEWVSWDRTSVLHDLGIIPLGRR